MSEQLQICQDLYSLFELCGPIWSSSEGMMEIYIQGAFEKGASASLSTLSAVLAGKQAHTAFQAANLHRSAAILIMENPPTESLFWKWGRSLGMNDSPTPKQIAQARASDLESIANDIAAWAVMKAIFAIITGIMALIVAIFAGLSYRKSRIFGKVHKHTYNVAVVALQTRTTLGWVTAAGGNVVFEDGGRSAWEAYMKAKYGERVRQGQLGPEFVREEIRTCAMDLTELGGRIQAEIMKTNLSGLT